MIDSSLMGLQPGQWINALIDGQLVGQRQIAASPWLVRGGKWAIALVGPNGEREVYELLGRVTGRSARPGPGGFGPGPGLGNGGPHFG